MLTLATLLGAGCAGSAPTPSLEEIEASVCAHLLVVPAKVDPTTANRLVPEQLGSLLSKALNADASLLRAADEDEFADYVLSYAEALDESEPTVEPIHVFLKEDVSSNAMAEIERLIRGTAGVASVSFESQQEAYEKFLMQFEDPELTRDVGPEDLPESFTVRVSNVASAEAIQLRLGGHPAIEEVDVPLFNPIRLPPLPMPLSDRCAGVLDLTGVE